MIACPACGLAMGVNETRNEAGYIRRRRICVSVACGHRVTTFELIVSDPRLVPDSIIVSRRALESVARVLVNDAVPEPVDE